MNNRSRDDLNTRFSVWLNDLTVNNINFVGLSVDNGSHLSFNFFLGSKDNSGLFGVAKSGCLDISGYHTHKLRLLSKDILNDMLDGNIFLDNLLVIGCVNLISSD
jgi:hypothetical protein